MKSKQRMLISVLVAVILILGVPLTQTADAGKVPKLDLTREQISKLGTLIEEFSTKALDIAVKIDNKLMELKQDLKKEDRFDTKAKARAASRNVNKLVKDIASLYGDLLKTRVEYLLKAKDAFSDEQKAQLLAALLDFDMDLPDDFSHYLEVDLPSLGLDLTKQQNKLLLKYRAEMDIKDIKLELEMDYKLLDLEEEIQAEKRDPQKVNKIIMRIVNLGTKIIENRIDHILWAKDVLTVEQKKELLHMMMMM
jgi:hypothetical protein